jgi:hypothetical protein
MELVFPQTPPENPTAATSAPEKEWQSKRESVAEEVKALIDVHATDHDQGMAMTRYIRVSAKVPTGEIVAEDGKTSGGVDQGKCQEEPWATFENSFGTYQGMCGPQGRDGIGKQWY